MPDLSVLIPARNEEFLARTIEDVLANLRGDTEVIAVLDGAWPDPPIPQHPRVTLLHVPEPVGQRAATNLAARVSTAPFIMKLDAHCAVAEGFDVALMAAAETLGPAVTQIPAQYNLHAFDWVCSSCGHRTYQGPRPAECGACDSPENTFRKEIVWKPRRSRRTEFWRFDADLHFQYFNEYKTRPEAQGDIVDVMTSLGACWFQTRDRFFALGGLDEAHGSWGQLGVEVACKAWLSGGRHVVNRSTWFAHFFRVGGIGFPYPISGSDQDRARAYSRQVWRGNTWPQAVRPLSWIVDKFWPVPGWTEQDRAALTDAAPARQPEALTPAHVARLFDVPERMIAGAPSGASAAPAVRTAPSAGLVYYTDNRGDEAILSAVRRQLTRVAATSTPALPIIAVSLAPLDWPEADNIVLPLDRGILTMFRQILAGLEALATDVAFLVEHDVLYHPSHVQFRPARDDVYYYNEHVWKVDAATGRALFYFTKQTSGLCANRQLLVDHYRARIARVEREGFSRSMGFEPGTHRFPRGVDTFGAERWMSAVPNLDIRHGHNLTQSRWQQDQFRNAKSCLGWTEADAVPSWGTTRGRMQALIDAI